MVATADLFDQQAFPANTGNKERLIQLLRFCFNETGFPPVQSNGDADLDIVSSAIHIASKKPKSVAVVAEDTDVLACHPSIHSLGGCDTTSAVFGLSKTKAFSTLSKDQSLRPFALVTSTLFYSLLYTTYFPFIVISYIFVNVESRLSKFLACHKNPFNGISGGFQCDFQSEILHPTVPNQCLQQFCSGTRPSYRTNIS